MERVIENRFPRQQGVGKAQYFQSGAQAWKVPPRTPAEVISKWRKEYELCDCATCYDDQCQYRFKVERFPLDAGGQDQCLRLMQSKSRYTWRNGNGEVITIPDEVVSAINGE